MIDVFMLSHDNGFFLSCRQLADRNDIVESLTASDFKFVVVGSPADRHLTI